jgi:hypothetical protein
MKFKCRIGLHKWSKWEFKGEYKVTHTHEYLTWIEHVTYKNKYLRVCECCGKPQSKFIS